MSMGLVSNLFLAVACLCLTGTIRMQADSTPPTFAKSYTVSGTLHMYEAQIHEPIDAYFDQDNKASRVDYYNGMTKTIQRLNDGQYGTSYKFAHVAYDDSVPHSKCFSTAGASYNPVSLQSVLPNLDSFQLTNASMPCGNTLCSEWEKSVTYYDKTIISVAQVTLGGAPFSYIVVGLDIYLFEYHDYKPGPVDNQAFNISSFGMDCDSMQNPSTEDLYEHHPMKDLVDHEDHHYVHRLFNEFKEKHGKVYANETEHDTRKQIFRQNLRQIHSFNRAGKGFKLAINHFGDMTQEEFKKMRGRLHRGKEDNGGIMFDKRSHQNVKLPDTVDWNAVGAVTPVKDQAMCGSCWSFGTTGTIEGAYYLLHNESILLSEQALVDCSWGEHNFGCDGGLDYRAYQWIRLHGGIPTNDSYGPYLGEDGLCHVDSYKVTRVANITDFVNVPSGDLQALKAAIAIYGPVSVSIDASLNTFMFYSSGIYYDSQCANDIYDLDHTVLAVGYGVEDGQAYWLIKNSWSFLWGNQGYIKMSQKDNNCGVATAPTFVFLEGQQIPSTIFPSESPTTASHAPITTTPNHGSSIAYFNRWLSTVVFLLMTYIGISL